MLSPSRGPERLVRLGQWLIALLFAYFLIQVGGSLIADLPLLSRRQPQERFVDTAQVGQLERLTERQLLAAEATAREQTSFDNWRAARLVTEQSQQNPEVLARARQRSELLALWQFRRFRSSDQWPFVWGFLLFGLFAAGPGPPPVPQLRTQPAAPGRRLAQRLHALRPAAAAPLRRLWQPAPGLLPLLPQLRAGG